MKATVELLARALFLGLLSVSSVMSFGQQKLIITSRIFSSASKSPLFVSSDLERPATFLDDNEDQSNGIGDTSQKSKLNNKNIGK